MAGNATGANVRCITGTTKDDTALACFLTAADLKVAQVAVCNPDLSDDELNAIADWYASYLLAAGGSDSSLNIAKEKFEQYEVTFGGTTGEGASARYWNTANDLSGGCLKDAGLRKTNTFFF